MNSKGGTRSVFDGVHTYDVEGDSDAPEPIKKGISSLHILTLSVDKRTALTSHHSGVLAKHSTKPIS